MKKISQEDIKPAVLSAWIRITFPRAVLPTFEQLLAKGILLVASWLRGVTLLLERKAQSLNDVK
jgi:hypothetical protein